jgi:hypothetical protein
MSTVLTLLLTGCSATSTFVVVRKADGYYVVDGECPQRMISRVVVTPWDTDAGKPLRDPWTAIRPDATNTELPANGLAAGGDGAGWGSVSNATFSLEPGDTVMVQTARDGKKLGTADLYPLKFDVGQYVDSSGQVGQWSELVAAGDCLAE